MIRSREVRSRWSDPDDPIPRGPTPVFCPDRTWEAIAAGAVPVLVDVPSYRRCGRPSAHMREMSRDWALWVRHWAELPALLERFSRNASALFARQARSYTGDTGDQPPTPRARFVGRRAEPICLRLANRHACSQLCVSSAPRRVAGCAKRRPRCVLASGGRRRVAQPFRRLRGGSRLSTSSCAVTGGGRRCINRCVSATSSPRIGCAHCRATAAFVHNQHHLATMPTTLSSSACRLSAFRHSWRIFGAIRTSKC